MKKIISLILMLIIFGNLRSQMILEFDTNLSDGTTINIPLSGNVNVTVDWGDGNVETYNLTGNYTHTYLTEDVYTVTISGTLSRYGYQLYQNSDKLTKVISFGDIGLISLANAFKNATNLSEVPDVLPSAITDLSSMFYGANIFNYDIGVWDVSNVTDMSYMFAYASFFNQNISSWDVSNVTNMEGMFSDATSFNQNIGNWNVNNVTIMKRMFRNANSFNQDISSWDVSNVTNMASMFYHATSFNQNIGSWNLINVTDISGMFHNANSFNQDVGNWDVSNVTAMNSTFYGASVFNKDIGNWDVSNVTSMYGTFSYSNSFNQDIGNWDVSNVTNMECIFDNATSFNQNIGSWNVSNVTNMSWMFYNANSFNQDIGSWNVSNVTNMYWMFRNASSFNQDINSWDVSNVTNMASMFNQATSFNQNIGNWNVSNVSNMTNMFYNVTLLIDNYDGLLIGWSQQTLQQNVNFCGGNSQYSCNEGATAREVIINTYNWSITDGGELDNTNPEISSTHNDQTVDADANCEASLPDYTGDVTATDNCDTNLDVTQNPTAGTTISGATNQVSLTVTDDAGNTDEVTFNVTVEDNTNPEILCVENQEVDAAGTHYYTVQGTEFDPTEALDNCGVASIENNFNNHSTLAGAQISEGITTIVWTVVDNAGNENTCSFDLVVNNYVSVGTLQQNGISIYPNPTNGIINFEFVNTNIKKLTISDIMGKKIIKKTTIGQKGIIDLSSFVSGIYIISIQTDSELFNVKIVKR